MEPLIPKWKINDMFYSAAIEKCTLGLNMYIVTNIKVDYAKERIMYDFANITNSFRGVRPPMDEASIVRNIEQNFLFENIDDMKKGTEAAGLFFKLVEQLRARKIEFMKKKFKEKFRQDGLDENDPF